MTRSHLGRRNLRGAAADGSENRKLRQKPKSVDRKRKSQYDLAVFEEIRRWSDEIAGMDDEIRGMGGEIRGMDGEIDGMSDGIGVDSGP